MNHLYQALRERLCLPEGKLRLFPMWRSLTGLFPCLLVLLLSPSSRAAAPANDTFASSHLLTGAAGDVNGNTTDATREAGEPELTATSAGGSLWYSWHCSSGGTFDLEVGNGFVVGVFTGMDVDALVAVGVNPGRKVRVTLTPGWVYRVAVDSEGGARGVFSLRWKQTLRPGGGPDLMVPQDRIQLAVVEQSFPLGDCEVTERCVLSGKRRLLRFDMHTVNAGSEDIVFGAPSASPLFQYAPCHNHYHFEALAVYRVLTVSNTLVRSGNKFGFCLEDVDRYSNTGNPMKRYTCDDQGLQAGWSDVYSSDLPCQYVDVTGLPPGEYLLEIELDPLQQIPESDESNNSCRVPFVLSAPCTAKPSNDDFLSAQVLAGNLITVLGDTSCATRQAGEPSHAPLNASPASRSIWFKWTPSESAEVVMSTEGSGFDTVLAVYAGSTLGAAGNNRIGFHDDISVYQRQSRLRFDAVAGTQYMIAVDGAELSDGAQGGLVVFSINPSGNDEFSTRAELAGQQASVLGYIGNATHEPGEPQHGPTPGEGSLWYEWTAPASGPVVFHTIGSDVDTFLSIYSGSDLPSLAMVVRDDDSGGHGTSRVEWSAVQGQRYQIAVDRKSGTLSPSAKLVIRLSWEAATIQQAPSISKPPSSITTVIGSNVLFTVSATGTLPLTYQWSFGGAPLLEGQGVQGVQSPNLVLSDIDELDRGLYQVEVSNSLGRALSPAVNLVAASATRVIFVEPMIVSPGDVVPVQVSIASQSAEHSVAFSLSFDPGRISDPQISLDPGLPATTALQVDPSLAQAGFVGVRVLLPPGLALATGKHRLVTMHCRVANGIPDEERLRICFEDSPVRREVLGTLAQALSTSYGCGSLIAATRDILSVALRPDGKVELTLVGSSGTSHEFQRSEDLLNWTGFATEVNLGGIIILSDDVDAPSGRRFYRTLRR